MSETNSEVLVFGPYRIEVFGEEPKRHAVIRREDRARPEPTWYEMQHMKCLALRGSTIAIEVFPAMQSLVDGEHQRHLWEIDQRTGMWMKSLIARIGGE